jgi:CBS domain-containing protein
MSIIARDIMSTRFTTLKPGQTVPEAVQAFFEASESYGYQVFGMAVTDDENRLLGMCSMYDILLLLRPKHIQIWGEFNEADLEGLVDEYCRRAGPVLVGDIMTSEVLTVEPGTHIFKILDLMVKRHIRRLPVIDGGKMVGMVYFSRVFTNLGAHLLE